MCSEEESGEGLIDGVAHPSAPSFTHPLNGRCGDSIMCQALTSGLEEDMWMNKICQPGLC